MTEVRFYHLQRQTLDEALPKLVEKVCEVGLKTIIKTPNATLMGQLDKVLWCYDPESYIPHDIEGCKSPEQQPVYITTGDENPSSATVQLLVNAAESTETATFDRCLYMFDGRDEAIVSAARLAWKAYKGLGWGMSYWQQREMGGWEQKI